VTAPPRPTTPASCRIFEELNAHLAAATQRACPALPPRAALGPQLAAAAAGNSADFQANGASALAKPTEGRHPGRNSRRDP